jgi:hypothetical protein
VKKETEKAAAATTSLPNESGNSTALSQAESKMDSRLTLEKVRQAANRGDTRAQQAIRACVKNSPSICAEFGNATKHVEMALIDSISGGEILTSSAIARQAEKIKQELAGPAPTALVEMASQRVVVTWLALQHTEMQFLQSQKDVQWARYWLRRLEVADKIHRAAIGSLVLIRDLLPNTAPASMPAIVDARPQAAKPEAGDMIVPLVPDEIIMGNGPGVNRIADLVACPGNSRRFAMDGQADVKPKTNGYHHDLGALLANSSNRPDG